MPLKIYRPLDRRPTIWEHPRCLSVAILCFMLATAGLLATLFIHWSGVFAFFGGLYWGIRIVTDKHRPMEPTDEYWP